MNALTQTKPAAGHNSGEIPPLVAIDLDKLRDGLAERYAAMIARVAEHNAAFGRFQANHAAGLGSDEVAGKIGDWAKQLGGLSSEIDGKRKAEKEAPLAAGKAIDAFFAAQIDQLDAIKRSVMAALTKFAQEKERKRREELAAQAKREAEEAARLAAQAEVRQDESIMNDALAAEQRAEDLKAAATTAPSADLSRTRGDFGSVTSLRTTWGFEVDDLTKVPATYLLLNEQMVRAAIRTAPKKDGVPQINIPGIRVVAEQKAGVR